MLVERFGSCTSLLLLSVTTDDFDDLLALRLLVDHLTLGVIDFIPRRQLLGQILLQCRLSNLVAFRVHLVSFVVQFLS